MTYELCKKLITDKKADLSGDEWLAFVEDMKFKLDVFLLNDRITKEQYEELMGMME